MPCPSAVPRGSGTLAVGKPSPVPRLAPPDDGAGDAPSRAEQTRGAFDVALRQPQADGARGEHLAVLGDGLNDGDAEAEPLRRRAHGSGRAGAPLAEEEVVADDDVADAEPLDEHVGDEVVGRQAGERRVEGEHDGEVEAEALEQRELLRQAASGGSAAPRGGRTRAGAARRSARRPARRARAPYRGSGAQQRLMAAMHAVEIADARAPRRAPPAGTSL